MHYIMMHKTRELTKISFFSSRFLHGLWVPSVFSIQEEML
ncbi:hypothetical protein BLGI_694 [Brevibacillus laterosporus GI-9]|nr:hypothetical protein BLGI_694 [Brevibacillus laterosporus GI-9]